MRGGARSLAVAAGCLSLLWAGPPAAHATFPGRDGLIAFASSVDSHVTISTMRADGSQRTTITRRLVSRSPAWSADGDRIVYTASGRHFPEEVFVMRADGTGVRRLTTDDEPQAWPTWSPSGERIAFVFMGRHFNYRIATMGVDGRDRQVLTPHRGDAADPDWSPDGSRIAFDMNGQIATMGPRGGSVQIVTTEGGFDPSWSPNGRWIAYESGGDLYRIRVGGSGLQRLTATGIEEHSPSWSPSGRRIAYLRTRSNDERSRYLAAIWTMAADGSDPRRVLRRVSGEMPPLEAPAWQPEPPPEGAPTTSR